MLQTISLQVNTDLTASERVLAWFEQLNNPPLLDTTLWWQCKMLLQEGFTNIVEHAHGSLPPETPVELEATRSDRAIEIRIWGYGTPFDLEQQLKQSKPLEENEGERGRGLQIMANLADQLSYDRTLGDRYCLLIIKRIN